MIVCWNWWVFLWGEYGSKDFRSFERWYRKIGIELYYLVES